eukprot:ANDGO_07850.mRNA.1 hypothetical protein
MLLHSLRSTVEKQCAFDVCEAVHAMGAGVDAADRSGGGPAPEGGGGDATTLAQRCGRDVHGALHGQ